MSVMQGKIIISTCAEDKAQKIKNIFEFKGAQVFNFPLIQIQQATHNIEKITEVLSRLNAFDWMVFTSTNGVKYLIHWLDKLGLPKDFGHLKIAAIGAATAKSLSHAGMEPHFISQSKDSVEFAHKLQGVLPGESQKILIPTGNLASENLLHILGNMHECEQLVVYDTLKNGGANQDLWQRIHHGNYDLILFLSPSAVKEFMAQSNSLISNRQLKCAAIGKTTKQALINVGVIPKMVPSQPNIEQMLTEIEAYFENNFIQNTN